MKWISLALGLILGTLLVTGHGFIAFCLLAGLLLVFVGAIFGCYIVLTRRGEPL